MTRPFEGIRVIDVTHVLAGPFAAYQLAVLGADVIKVDHPDDPDQSRVSGTDKALNRKNMGTGFLTQASNKRSIALDLKKESDREVLKKLVATADVFVENYRPGAFDALGLGLRGPVEDQSAADLRVVLGVRPEGPARPADRLRSRHPGDLRHHGDDRDEGCPPRQVRLARGRLCDRHDGRVRAVGRAVPAREDRARPAHRHGDARRRDDPDELARHRLSAQRRASQAARQPPSARHQRRVPDQGRPGDARRLQPAPAEAAVDGARAPGDDQEDQRRARRRSRARDRGARGDHAHPHRRRVGGVPAGPPCAGRARAHHGRGDRRSADRDARHHPSLRLRHRDRRRLRRAARSLHLRARRPAHRHEPAASSGSTTRKFCASLDLPGRRSATRSRSACPACRRERTERTANQINRSAQTSASKRQWRNP